MTTMSTDETVIEKDAVIRFSYCLVWTTTRIAADLRIAEAR
jgi:hypothetical protein